MQVEGHSHQLALVADRRRLVDHRDSHTVFHSMSLHCFDGRSVEIGCLFPEKKRIQKNKAILYKMIFSLVSILCLFKFLEQIKFEFFNYWRIYDFF